MRYVIHIGGNKTGSTTLQRHLFSKHQSIGYIGEDCSKDPEIIALLDSLIRDDDSHFDFNAVEHLFHTLDEAETAVNVFSSEDIMTSPLPSVCAARLKKLMPDAHIVMVVRNQLTTWPSWYVNHGAFLKWVPSRYWRRHVEFEEWLDFCFKFPKQTPVEAMNYARFYRIFRKMFGEEQIHVFTYEELVASPQRYYQRWADVLGIDLSDIMSCVANHVERRRGSSRRFAYNRWMSQLSWFPHAKTTLLGAASPGSAFGRWLDRGIPFEIDLPERWNRIITDYYQKSNIDLAETVGLDLRSYGYPYP